MLVNKCVKKLNRLLGKKVKFRIRYDSTKLSQFCSNKDSVPTLQKSNVFYSGTPLRPKAAGVDPHTHTKRRVGNFLWSMASGMAHGRVRRTSVRPSLAFHDILT